jgi:Uncharacterised protein family (UPF0236)
MTLTEQIIAVTQHWQEQLRTASQPSNGESLSMATLEQAALALGQRVAQLALTEQLRQAGTGYTSSSRLCDCGKKQRFQRYSEKTVRTLFGEVIYERAYYRCRHCGAGACPLDQQLGQSAREISPGVERALALLSAHLPFAKAEQMLAEVTAVRLSARQIETIAESLGAAAEQRQQQEQQQAATQGLAEPRGPHKAAPRTFIIEMDGVQLGLQDGSWQEVKCGVIYELSQRVEIHSGRWELWQRWRCALRGGVAGFRQRLWALCLRIGIRQQDHLVVLGDGAEWIDQTAEWLFPKALRILDYYHASERVWAVANARWGEATVSAQRWAHSKLSQLKRGRVKQVIAAMQGLKISSEEGQRVRQAAINYMRARQAQMRYGEYQKAGLPIGSGAVESTCKQMVTARCKQAGMRWSEVGADAILALRSFVLNERLDELCPKPTVSLDWARAA